MVDKNYKTVFQCELMHLIHHSPSCNRDFSYFWLLQATTSTFATALLQDNALAKGQNSASSFHNQELSSCQYNRIRWKQTPLLSPSLFTARWLSSCGDFFFVGLSWGFVGFFVCVCFCFGFWVLLFSKDRPLSKKNIWIKIFLYF